MGHYTINLVDETGELAWNNWRYIHSEDIDKSVRDILLKGARIRYMPFDNGKYAGLMWLLVSNEYVPCKKLTEGSLDDVYEIYPEGEEPYLISDLWDGVKSKKLVFLDDGFDGLRAEYGEIVPLNNKGVSTLNYDSKEGTFVCGLADYVYGNGYVRVGGLDSEFFDGNTYPFNTMLVDAKVVKCKSERKNHLGETVYKVFTGNIGDTFKEDTDSLIIHKLDDASRQLISSYGIWFLGEEEGLDEISIDSDGEYHVNGEEIIEGGNIELGDPVEFVWLKVYTDEKTRRHFIAKDVDNRWYTDGFGLLEHINMRVEHNRKYINYHSFDECVSIYEITKDYDGFDNYLNGRQKEVVWVKVGDEWYSNKSFTFRKEDSENIIRIAEKISKNRKEEDNILPRLKKIGKEIKI